MNHLKFLTLICLVLSHPLLGRELATGSTGFASVEVDPETRIVIQVDEVCVEDFKRLMPERTDLMSGEGPIHSVTQEEANEYAERLTQLNRELGLLGQGETLRLPSLQEWLAVSNAPENEKVGIHDFLSGLRELCLDRKVETFPSRDNPEEMEEHLFVAVIGSHYKADSEAITDLNSRPAWVRAATRSELIGFRLVLANGED